jgi:hypothetical protein
MPISTAPPSRKSKMGAPDSPSGPTDRRDHEAAQPHDQHGPTSRVIAHREALLSGSTNHFEMAESLGNPYWPNGRAALALMKLAPA